MAILLTIYTGMHTGICDITISFTIHKHYPSLLSSLCAESSILKKMSELRVSLFEALAHYDPSFNQQKMSKCVFGLCSSLSFLFSSLLIHFSHGWRDEFFALFENKFDVLFNSYTFDVFLLNAIQSIIVSYNASDFTATCLFFICWLFHVWYSLVCMFWHHFSVWGYLVLVVTIYRVLRNPCWKKYWRCAIQDSRTRHSVFCFV
jgi:hypothetical protein